MNKNKCKECGEVMKPSPPLCERTDNAGLAMTMAEARQLFMPGGICRACGVKQRSQDSVDNARRIVDSAEREDASRIINTFTVKLTELHKMPLW